VYSRNTMEKRGSYNVPPGYDGSRFRRRQRRENGGDDEIILVPDSGFAKTSERVDENRTGELSVRGIPTSKGQREFRKDPNPDDTDVSADTLCEESNDDTDTDHKCRTDKLTSILDKFGFSGGLSSEELLICAVIFIIASDNRDNGRNVGDILLILALLLGIR